MADRRTGPQYRDDATTRRRTDPATAQVITVGMFAPHESQAYLRSRLSADPAVEVGAEADDGDLTALATALGIFRSRCPSRRLPHRHGTSIAAYRRLIDDRKERIDDLFPSSSPR